MCTGRYGGPVQTMDFKRRPAQPYVAGPSLLLGLNFLGRLGQFFALVTYICQCAFAVVKAVATPFGPHDSKTAINDTSKRPIVYTGKRRLIVCPDFALADLKEVKIRMGCTVNDVVFACLAGAIQRYLQHREDPAAKRTPLIRAAMPYSFPNRPTNPDCLTNSWTFVSLALPMGPMPIERRLREAQLRCALVKSTPEAWTTNKLNVVANAVLGPELQTQTIYDYMSRQTMVFTNVPGPTAPIVMFGSEVRNIVFGCPNLVSQVSVISYKGTVGLSLVVDPDVVKDAHLIGEFFQAELDELMQPTGGKKKV
mmetsp:Transcript_6552/g.16760  ORF Transcript_6552/g.16760 Transcript_6552/m.16760 type:complete len:310 (+) Transcript_6552:1-930(+)